jgi:hypothetical protein
VTDRRGLPTWVFTVLGLLSHRIDVDAPALLRTAPAMLAGWYAAALAFGVYRTPTIGRLAGAWIAGVAAGVTLRAVVLGSGFDRGFVTLLLVALAVTGGLLATWRAAGLLVARSRASAAP